MVSRFAAVFILAWGVLLSGCVSSGTYQMKEQESQQLGRSLEESRAAYAAMEKKLATVEGERGELEASLKKQKGELADSSARGEKLAFELAEAKGELEKLTRQNAEQAEKLKKLAVDFVEVKGDKEKLYLANQGLSVEVSRLTAENAELKSSNDRLAAAVRPENLLKTVGEQFEALQGRIDSLGAENAKLKETLLEMRKGTRLPPPGSSSIAPVEKPLVTVPTAVKPAKAAPAGEVPLPLEVRKEASRPVAEESLPAAVPVVDPAMSGTAELPVK